MNWLGISVICIHFEAYWSTIPRNDIESNGTHRIKTEWNWILMNFWCNIGFRLKGIDDSEFYDTTEQNCISQGTIFMDVARMWTEAQFSSKHHPPSPAKNGDRYEYSVKLKKKKNKSWACLNGKVNQARAQLHGIKKVAPFLCSWLVPSAAGTIILTTGISYFRRAPFFFTKGTQQQRTKYYFQKISATIFFSFCFPTAKKKENLHTQMQRSHFLPNCICALNMRVVFRDAATEWFSTLNETLSFCAE